MSKINLVPTGEKEAVRVAYGKALVELGKENDKVVVLDADLAAATMTNAFKKEFPDRFFDCGMFNFLIAPADLAARRWSAVHCYLTSA